VEDERHTDAPLGDTLPSDTLVREERTRETPSDTMRDDAPAAIPRDEATAAESDISGDGAAAASVPEAPTETSTLKLPTATSAPPPSREQTPSTWKRAQEAVGTRARIVLDILARRHPLVIGVAAVVCVLVAALAVIALRPFDQPSESVVIDAVREMATAPDHDAGPYVPDDPYSLTSLNLTDMARDEDGSYTATVAARFSNGWVTVSENLIAKLMRDEQGWHVSGGLQATDRSFSAESGVQPELVSERVATVLEKADGQKAGKSAQALVELYDDPAVKVGEATFDGSSESTLDLQLTDGTPYAQLNAQVATTFHFRRSSGTWELSEATASDDARTPDFSGAEGTWSGRFVSQEASGAKCLGARNSSLVVEVERVRTTSSGDVELTGTVSGLAHFHAEPTSDVNSMQGDEQVENVSITGTTQDDPLSENGMTFSCTTAEDARGTLALTLAFGDASDEDAVTAHLLTSGSYTVYQWLVIPDTADSSFDDTYALTRETA